MFGHPVAIGEFVDQGAIKLPRCLQVQVFEAGGLLQLGEAQSGGEPAVVALARQILEGTPVETALEQLTQLTPERCDRRFVAWVREFKG
jgi:hypothetical protein